jgi:hypothetical protein
LLLPAAKASVGLPPRGKPVSNCLNMTDAAIDAALRLISGGTQGGSSVPELKRRLGAAWPEAGKRIIPIHVAA